MKLIMLIACTIIGLHSSIKYFSLKKENEEKAFKYYLKTIFFIGMLTPLGLTFLN